MADLGTVIEKIEGALQEACALAGVVSPMDQATSLQAKLDAANAAVSACQTKYEAYVAAAQAAAQRLKDRDAASVDGQEILDLPT